MKHHNFFPHKKFFLACMLLSACVATPTNVPPTITKVVPTRLAYTLAPLPTQTSLPYPSPTPVSSSTPIPLPELIQPTVGKWFVKALEVETRTSYIWEFNWEDNSRLTMNYLPPDLRGETRRLIFDVANGVSKPTIENLPYPNATLFSPDRKYKIYCSESDLLIRSVADDLLIKQIKIPQNEYCRGYIDWAGDSSAISIVSKQGDIYVWRMNESEPYKLASGYKEAWWSPNQKVLMAIKSSAVATFDINIALIPVNGQGAISTFVISLRSSIHGVFWFTDNVVGVIAYKGYGDSYYEVGTGRFLFGYSYIPQINIFSQPPLLSANRRWVIVDQGSRPNDKPYPRSHRYTIYNLFDKSEYVIADGHDTVLKFAGWSDDSSTLYLVSRPATETAVSSPNTPFGLLAFDPTTRQAKNLFVDAVDVEWSPSRELAYVIFVTRNPDSSLGLIGGIWKVGSTMLIGSHMVSSAMIYSDPASEGFFDYPSKAVWSHDGKKVIVGDALGKLNLITLDGTVRQLATDLPNQWKGFSWSPDDRRVVVYVSTERRWIVTVPDP